MLANVVNRADVGVIQRGGGLGFALKTGEGLRIVSYIFGQEFERDEAMQPRVLGLVHHAHSAAAQFLDDAVVRDGLADHWSEILGQEQGKSMKVWKLGARRKSGGPIEISQECAQSERSTTPDMFCLHPGESSGPRPAWLLIKESRIHEENGGG